MNAFSFSFPVQFSPHWFSFSLRTLANETLREITLNIYFWDDCSRRLDDKHHYVMYINPPSGCTTHTCAYCKYLWSNSHKFKTNGRTIHSFTVTTFDHLKPTCISSYLYPSIRVYSFPSFIYIYTYTREAHSIYIYISSLVRVFSSYAHGGGAEKIHSSFLTPTFVFISAIIFQLYPSFVLAECRQFAFETGVLKCNAAVSTAQVEK